MASPALARLLLAALTALLGVLLAAPASGQPGGPVVTTEVRGAITQVTDDHLSAAITEAEETGAEALVVALDTPGGGLETTRSIVQSMLHADVPIIVHVEPSGSRAGSAGTFITYAAHVAAMAPGTTIGAATPVDQQGGEVIDKIIEDTASFAEALAEERDRDPEFAIDAVVDGTSVTAGNALDIGAIDLVVASQDELLDSLDGEEVPMGDGETVTLATAGASTQEFGMSFTRRVLDTLANPQLAFIFLSIGTLAIIYELANPGAGIGGAIGAVMLVLAFYSLSVLPTNAAGVALVLLGLGLLVAELFVPGVGVLAGGGAIALAFAGLLLFDRSLGIAVSWTVVVPTVLLAGAGAVAIGIMAARERRRPDYIGHRTLIGRSASVRRAEGPRGQVFVAGELWSASSTGKPLKPGDRVRVVDQEGLDLTVEHEEDT